MANYVSGINPEILKWARERSGYSLNEMVEKFNKIENWESGEETPTYVQLEKLAYTHYKLPIAIFFFPEPPQEDDIKKEFRTLPDEEIDKLQPDTRFALRQGKAMQIALEELNDGINTSEHKIFREIRLKSSDNIVKVAEVVRNYLDVPREKQFLWKDSDTALKVWQQAIEEKGIFVFKRPFKQEGISGFSLLDDEFPVIYLNNSTPRTRQVFTLFHELTHILLKTNGITQKDDRFINRLTGENKEIEVFCNLFASEFLVPSRDFNQRIAIKNWDDRSIGQLADRYSVSREVICRRLLDKKLVSQDFYEEKVRQWYDEFQKGKKRGKEGGNYYTNKSYYLGEKFLKLAFGRYYEGLCSAEQLSDYFNIKVSGISRLEEKLIQKQGLAS